MRTTRPRSTSALLLTLALLAGGGSLIGCTDSSSPAASAAPSATPTPGFDPDATLWTLASTGEELSLEDEDVQALQEVVALHSGASDNRSPATIVDSVDAEESFFTPLFVEKLGTDSYRDALVAMYVDNDLTIEQTGVAWTPSTIDAGRTKATVGFESLFRIVSASEGYLHELGVDAGAEFAQPREYTLTKIDGEWLIDDIAKGPLRATSQPTP
ncbi:MAG: hypothetical protein ACRDT7_02000 [Microbacterium sp.]